MMTMMTMVMVNKWKELWTCGMRLDLGMKIGMARKRKKRRFLSDKKMKINGFEWNENKDVWRTRIASNSENFGLLMLFGIFGGCFGWVRWKCCNKN